MCFTMKQTNLVCCLLIYEPDNSKFALTIIRLIYQKTTCELTIIRLIFGYRMKGGPSPIVVSTHEDAISLENYYMMIMQSVIFFISFS